MGKQVTDYRFWIGVASFLLTAGAVVFYGGKNAQKLDSIIEVSAKLEKQLPVMVERINMQDLRIAILEERLKRNQ